MKNLKTTFAGLELRNPIIVGSCEIGSSANSCAKAEKAGVGAIVLKSLFEEDIVRRTHAQSCDDTHSEGADYLLAYHSGEALNSYTTLIEEAKKACSIPIIASLNCHSIESWIEYSKTVAQAGADAIQLNVMSFNYSAKCNDGEVEQKIIEIVKSVKEVTSVPIIVKLPSNISAPVTLIARLHSYGVEAAAMFNSPYPVAIDVEKIAFTSMPSAKAQRSTSESLRWIALSSAAVPNIDYAHCSGVSKAEDVVAAILVGATAVEVVGAIYANDLNWVTESLEWVERWLALQGFDSIDEFKGRLNAKDDSNREHILCWQYLTT